MNELTPMQSFEQKVKERLVNDIGTLIPDEALVSLIENAMHSAFFEPQKEKQGSGYHEKIISKPSVFECTVKELIQPRFDEILKAWIYSHEEEVAKALEQFMNRNIEDVFLKAISSIFFGHFESMKYNIQSELSMAMNRG